jgi:hypothetical protein
VIKVGDLVWVDKLPSCGCPHALGSIFQVTELRESRVGGCVHCGAYRPEASIAFGDDSRLGVEVYRLKRIPPLDELEKQTEEESREVTA